MRHESWSGHAPAPRRGHALDVVRLPKVAVPRCAEELPVHPKGRAYNRPRGVMFHMEDMIRIYAPTSIFH